MTRKKTMLIIKRNRNRILAYFFVLLVIVLLVVWIAYLRYAKGYVWAECTGFEAKTLWDLLELIIIPAILGGGVVWFNRRQREAEIRHPKQRWMSGETGQLRPRVI